MARTSNPLVGAPSAPPAGVGTGSGLSRRSFLQITAAGADKIYGPNFGISDPLPLRKEARRRAMARGEAEAMEYAANAGFTRVRLLSVEEGVSYRSADIVVTGSRVGNASAPPPPPPPQPERGGVEPGQIETGVQLTLIYRMER